MRANLPNYDLCLLNLRRLCRRAMDRVANDEHNPLGSLQCRSFQHYHLSRSYVSQQVS